MSSTAITCLLEQPADVEDPVSQSSAERDRSIHRNDQKMLMRQKTLSRTRPQGQLRAPRHHSLTLT